jgi:hypothetical protein
VFDPETPQERAARERRLKVFEQVNLVQQMVAQGMSNRAVAKKLGCDEGTVRRHRKKRDLPEKYRTLIDRGAAVEPLFRRHDLEQQQARKLAQQEADRMQREYAAKERARRKAEEKQDSRHSDNIVIFVLAYLLTIKLRRYAEEGIATNVAKRVWLEDRADLPYLPPQNYQSFIQSFEKVHPLVDHAVPENIDTLHLLLQRFAPEWEIRNAAIDKIVAFVEWSSGRRPIWA